MWKRVSRISAALVAALVFASVASAQTEGVYQCMETQMGGIGVCPMFTSTNAEHVDAGRATVRFGRFRAVGTRESLGRDPDFVVTLFEIEPGRFSADPAACPAPANLLNRVDLLPAGPNQMGQSGSVLIVNNLVGPDLGIFRIEGLAPLSTFTLVIAESAAANSLPHSFLAEFDTDSRGAAEIVLATELINAYLGANPSRDADDDGIPEGPAAGSVANGAITISLDFFRVYDADGAANVFGVGPNDLSAAIVLTSTRIPDAP